LLSPLFYLLCWQNWKNLLYIIDSFLYLFPFNYLKERKFYNIRIFLCKNAEIILAIHLFDIKVFSSIYLNHYLNLSILPIIQKAYWYAFLQFILRCASFQLKNSHKMTKSHSQYRTFNYLFYKIYLYFAT
jgi:hypothetical protein